MEKSKSKKQHLFIILFLFLIIGGIVYILYSNIGLFFYKIKILNLNCNIPVLLRQDKRIVYDLSFSKDYKELEFVKIKIFVANNIAKKIVLKSNDWIRLYFNKEKAVQVKFLPRLYMQHSEIVKNSSVKKRICFVINNIIYLTGVVPNSIVIRTPDGILTYPVKFNGDILKNIPDKIDISKQDFTLEDGTKIKLYNFTNIYERIKKFERIDQVYDEGVTVEVLNATDKNGYATFWARVLQGLGFQVTHIYTLNYLFDYIPSNVKYFIYVDSSTEQSYSFNIIKELFKDNAYVTNTRPKGILTTSNIVIILVK